MIDSKTEIKPPFVPFHINPSDYGGEDSECFNVHGFGAHVFKPSFVKNTKLVDDLIIELDGFDGGGYDPDEVLAVGYMLIQAAIRARQKIKAFKGNSKEISLEAKRKAKRDRRRKYLNQEIRKLDRKDRA